MAILRGFPPSNTISPSVRITEKDLSFIAPEQSFHRAGLVGFASKGPINIPTAVATNRELHTVFGYPHPDVGDPYLIYAAEQYLLIANELWIVRVAETDAVSDEAATTASAEVLSAGGPVIIESNQYKAEAASWTFTAPKWFRWRINSTEDSTATGILSTKTLSIAPTASDINPITLTLDELIWGDGNGGTIYNHTGLNDQLDSINDDEMNFDGIIFAGSETSRLNGDALETGYLQCQSTYAYGPTATVELVSVTNSLYGPDGDERVGIGRDMTQAVTIGGNTQYPDDSSTSPGYYDIPADTYLRIVVDGTDNVLVDNIPQDIVLTSGVQYISDIVDDINDYMEANNIFGFTAEAYNTYQLSFTTDHFGRDARILVKTVGAYAVFGFDGLTASGESPAGYTGEATAGTGGIVYGSSDTSTVTFTITADSAGIEGNNTQVVIFSEEGTNAFRLDVYSSGVQVESWGNLTKAQASRYYVETFLALVSDYVRVSDVTTVGAPPAAATYDLSGGSDGIPSDPDRQDELLIGSDLGYTGIYALSEPEQIDIDLIAVPGHSSTSLIVALLDMCQNYRMDCLAVIDPPFGLTVREIVSWQNGTHPLNTTRFDSDFGALFWPWVKISDSYNGVDVWVPPSGSVMAVIARSDNLAEPWYASAGVTRGVVPGITDVFSRPTLIERDSMYGNRNCVNPIVQFSNAEGYMVWGNKTLQRTPTALDRINVRRLMFVIEKRIRQESRRLLFDPHDEEFRQQFVRIATSILSEVQIGRGITDFIIKADEELNTPDVIDRNEFRARIGVQPTRAVEYIYIEFSIHRTGSWSEGADNF